MLNISHQITSVDQLVELFETNETQLMVGIIPDEDIPLEYWTFYGKLKAGCSYCGWASIDNEKHIVIQSPGEAPEVDNESKPLRKIGAEQYDCLTPVEQIVITRKLFEKAKIYVEM